MRMHANVYKELISIYIIIKLLLKSAAHNYIYSIIITLYLHFLYKMECFIDLSATNKGDNCTCDDYR